MDAGEADSPPVGSLSVNFSAAHRPRKWLESSAPLGLAVSGFFISLQRTNALVAAVIASDTYYGQYFAVELSNAENTPLGSSTAYGYWSCYYDSGWYDYGYYGYYY
ncbi:hypothetical protein AYO47_00620 [Planctomyces sp. SCGC AG-212-M04]|nr:hypothetical protein AYO47_00620 [Planctomyces sp. SCGC AG-212-M04]